MHGNIFTWCFPSLKNIENNGSDSSHKITPHHMVDLREPHEGFSGGDFVRTVTPIIFDILERGKTPGKNITIPILF